MSFRTRVRELEKRMGVADVPQFPSLLVNFEPVRACDLSDEDLKKLCADPNPPANHQSLGPMPQLVVRFIDAPSGSLAAGLTPEERMALVRAGRADANR